MSFQDGWSAIHLEMPRRVPRTEYSAEQHWGLVQAVTGLTTGPDSSAEEKQRAVFAFQKAWNYDFLWSILIHRQIFGELRTSMGHAEYAAAGADFVDDRRCPFSTPQEVLGFDPAAAYGPVNSSELTRQFEEHYQMKCSLCPDAVNMTGIYVTCISGMLEIFGWDMLLLALGTDPEAFGEMTNRYAAWMQGYFDALAAAEVPVVMVHDDIVWSSGAFARPDWYRTYVFPQYRKYFRPLRDSGKKIMFTSDGNYTAFIDDIAQAGVHGFVLEPYTDMKAIAERYGRTHVFIGNADTRALLENDRKKIRAEVERCMAIGKPCPGFFMAVGNHIPPNTPVEAALYYNEVYEELSKR